MEKFDFDYTNPYGFWEVTTEGDCEGKSKRKLGIYQGYIDDIAFALADKCYYSLRFKKLNKLINEIPIAKNLRENVSVSLNIDSDTWDMSSKERVLFFEKMLSKRNVTVDDGNFYASVILKRVVSEEDKKKTALSKLTQEEKKLLGLE